MRKTIDNLLQTVFRRRPDAKVNPDSAFPTRTATQPRPRLRKASLGAIDLQQTAASVVSLYNQAPELAATARRMDTHAREQAETLDNLVLKTDEIAATLNSAVKGLDESSKDAFSSVKLIRDITEGSRILAINASIEAARAGQAGLAFNVVAVEMQRLARQIEDASEHLARTLEAMQNKVSDVVRVSGKNADRDPGASGDDSSVAFLTRAFHEIDARALEQQKEARGVSEMAEQTRAISDGLLMEVGKMRFDIHFKSEAVVAELVRQPVMASGDRSRIEPILEEAIRRCPFFDLFYLTDARGRQITRNVSSRHSDPEDGMAALDKDWSKRPWFTNAFECEGPFTTDLYLSVATQRFCFTVSEAILDEAGTVVGVLGADVDFERLVMLRRPGPRRIARRPDARSPLALAPAA